MAIQSRKVFVDSSAFVSFIDRSDSNHSIIVKALETLAKNKCQLYTSLQVVQEVYATTSRDIGVSVALDFLQASLLSDIETIFPQKVDLITAHRMIKGK